MHPNDPFAHADDRARKRPAVVGDQLGVYRVRRAWLVRDRLCPPGRLVHVVRLMSHGSAELLTGSGCAS
ncbi:hypothetical protein [Amycolatopsis sp. NPDC004625]|uniref:hypothetical protein n=1 Tax=Amycolatopsis sp. NPDC004625 TaxID=3154670 RepID=UPI0033AF631D